MVTLIETEDGVEAEMVCALLRGYGVRCVASGSPGTGGGLLTGMLGWFRSVAGGQLVAHRVLVHADDLGLAREVLAAPPELEEFDEIADDGG